MFGTYCRDFFRPLMVFALTALWLPSMALAQELPYQGVVIKQDVQVRADVGESYYVLARLDEGTVVEVDDVIMGWYKIVPTDNCYSFVSKAFVNAKGDGSTGVVSVKRLPVKAASIDSIPGESHHRQLWLFEGDTVAIVSEEGSFYKITPPAGVHVYLPPGSIKPLEKNTAGSEKTVEPIPVEQAEVEKDSQAEAVEAAGAAAVASGDSTDTTQTPEATGGEMQQEDSAATEVAAVTGTTAAIESEPQASEQTESTEQSADEAVTDQEKPVEVAMAPVVAIEPSQAIKELPLREEIVEAEAQADEALTLELEQQPLDELDARYQALAMLPDLNEHESQVLMIRISQITRNRELLEAVQIIAAKKQEVEQAPEKPDYDFQGILTGSSVYDGEIQPLLYRLVDLYTGRTIAYIHPNAAIDLYQAMGREIGIYGQTAIDVETGVKMLVIDEYELATFGK